MRRAATAETVATHQGEQWQAAQRTLSAADDLRAKADAMQHAAQVRFDAARATVAAIRNRDLFAEIAKASGGMNGVTIMAAKCANVNVTVDICSKPPWNENNLTFDAVVVERAAYVRWPQLHKMYGYRPWDPFPTTPAAAPPTSWCPTGERHRSPSSWATTSRSTSRRMRRSTGSTT